MKAKFRKSSVIALGVAFVMLFTLFAPVDVSAANKKPYKDVTVKKVGKIGYESIKVVKKRGAWKDVPNKKGELKPTKQMPMKKVVGVIQRYHKVKISISKAEKKKRWNKPVTCKWVYTQMSIIAKKKYQVKSHGVLWDTSFNDKTKVTPVRLAIILAAIKDPYVDVTKKTVTQNQWPTVVWCKDHGLYKGVYGGKYFYPNNAALKCEVARNLANGWSMDKIPTKYHADFYSTEPVTVGWFCAITSDLCVSLTGESFDWYGSRGDEELVTRAQASNMLWVFASAGKELMPKQ